MPFFHIPHHAFSCFLLTVSLGEAVLDVATDEREILALNFLITKPDYGQDDAGYF